jgi:aryl-alcohol dehydrogenase-like predicted oxidoreductase
MLNPAIPTQAATAARTYIIEREHVPAAQACGLGITPWSPLAGSFLAGKYEREGDLASGQGRLSGSNPFQEKFTKFTERNWRVLDTLPMSASS